MDCFPDYCLTCDRQITDGLYCSQTCRLTDLERAGASVTNRAALASAASETSASRTAYQDSSVSASFYLPPAVDFNHFSSYFQQQRSYSSGSLSSTTQTSHEIRQSSHHTTSAPSTPSRLLSPSSSRSSLSSSSYYRLSSDGLSDEARNELRGYFDSFNQSKERRRRSNPQIYHCGTSSSGEFADEHR